jgi:hypothetical protein
VPEQPPVPGGQPPPGSPDDESRTGDEGQHPPGWPDRGSQTGYGGQHRPGWPDRGSRTGYGGQHRPGWPDRGSRTGYGDWPDDEDWPGDDQPDDYVTGLPWPAAQLPRPAEPGPGIGPGSRLRQVLGPLVVAVLAAAAGAGLALAFTGSSGSPSAAGSSSSPGYVSPGGSANPGGSGQNTGGAPPGGGVATLFLVGRVTAVSATSITIAGAGPTVTAAVTPSTRISGRVSSIREIRVGDQVSAVITQSGGRNMASAIAYPPQQSGGAGVP